MKLLLLGLMRWSITALLVLAATLVALWLWHRYETEPWTRDGHVYADVVRVSPDISGLVTEVAVHDNERVHKGQLLFVVDRPRYTDALAQADAAIASARAILEQARRVARRDRALGELVATEASEEDDAKVQTSLAALNQALAARSTSAASALWHQADVAAMADAPIIPFMTQLTPKFHSARVHNALWSAFSSSYDLSQIWLS